MVGARKALSQAFGAWEKFLFRRTDPTGLAVFRIVIGLYLLYYYLDLFQFLHLHYFPPGLLLPKELNELGGWNILSLVRYATVPRYSAYVLTLASAIALSIGLQTRPAASLCWILHQGWLAVPVGRNSGDNAVAVAIFLFLLASWAGYAQRAYSLDARLRRNSIEEHRIPAGRRESSRYSSYSSTFSLVFTSWPRRIGIWVRRSSMSFSSAAGLASISPGLLIRFWSASLPMGRCCSSY